MNGTATTTTLSCTMRSVPWDLAGQTEQRCHYLGVVSGFDPNPPTRAYAWWSPFVFHGGIIMPRWLWIGLLGVALFVPAALYWVWIFDQVRPADLGTAFQRFAAVPLNRAMGERGVDVEVAIPDDVSWRRVIRNWGDPGFIIGVVSPGPRHYMYCLKDLGVHLEARIADQPIGLETISASSTAPGR